MLVQCSMVDEGKLLKKIAAARGYTPRGPKLALDKHLGKSGERMSDGRLRRGNASAGKLANGRVA